MKRLWSRRSVRVSLTFWYVQAMLVILAVYAAIVFAFVSHNVSRAQDDRLRGDLQWAAEMAEQRPDGTLTWFEGPESSVERDGPWLQVWDRHGDLLFRTDAAARQPIAGSDKLAVEADGRIVAVERESVVYRVLSRRSTVGGQPVTLQVARTEAEMRQDLRTLLLILVLGLPLGVCLAGLGGYSLARRALAPVDRMAERARTITAERLSDRLPVDNPNDELGRLAIVFNDTLARLQSAFEHMRRFTADVSHELRTPLTSIRSVGEVGLRGRRDAEGYRVVISSMLEEAERLSCLVDRLLMLSRAESGQAKLVLEVIDVSELATEVVGHLGVLAEEKQQSLELEIAAAPRCLGDRLILRQALINVVDNAIKYTPVSGRITVRVGEMPAGALVEVCDTGPGIPVEPKARIFDRFYRGDKGQAPGTIGTGLGLSIAKWAVEANGGSLNVKSSDSGGSRFWIILPLVASVPISESGEHLPSRGRLQPNSRRRTA